MPWVNLDTNALKSSTLFEEGSGSFKFLDLTRQQRLIGFCACLAGGFAISLVGAVLFTFGQITSFALLYVIGIVVSLVGTGFLIGFFKQLKLMFKPERIGAALIFLGSIAMVFVSAFILHNDLLVIIFAIVSYVAYIWYALSYIPYARGMASKIVHSIV
ncbi:uncharacterized protein L969DRAFT_92574 [Mixia osmundae IAM 14324]|uniref:Protein transport protein SFT2 n=1 Tax=Mixia osmundae (strain CBS 9802 / IAM 14324 / JCM 22182 / KY 12970) TaxID=764103 RepID=G7DXX9_MIXOS|nr:uncharacterized protein L969DRAFT_92574 [Mixia osmundae IAM 14324]KEI41342.1 hypothetical protein L969DRAFT_92574 [Mixia osmundae IAM 14324]GAA95439.1 hypothetical protein E5Q_02093 [Mixia osmundae IAM 14324]